MKERARWSKMSPGEQFYEEISKYQFEFEKSIEALRKRMGGL